MHSIGLLDFVQMTKRLRELPLPAGSDIQQIESDKPLTVQILLELRDAPSTAREIADVLGLDRKLVAGTLSNMKKQRRVKFVGDVDNCRHGPIAYMYQITAAGLLRIRGME